MIVDNYSLLIECFLNLLIPTWFITAGTFNWSSCPHQPLLPTWAIILGSLGVALNFSILYKEIKIRNSGGSLLVQSRISDVIGYLDNIILLWHIVGTFLIYSSSVSYDQESSDYCVLLYEMNVTTFNINPYFNPQPTSYFLALKILCLVSTIVTGISLYTIAFKSPPFLSRVFIGLLLFHFSVGILAGIHLSFFSIVIIYLPYMAVKCDGMYSTLGIPTVIQLAIDVNLLIIIATTIVPVFYYRMDAILPREHILNSKALRYSVYTIFYEMVNTLPIPVVYMIIDFEDQHKLKQFLLQTTAVYFEDFLSDEVIAARLDGSNPFAIILLYILLFMSFLAVAMVLISAGVIWKLTSKVGIIGSMKYKAQQRQLLLSLTTMSAFFIPAAGIIVPWLAVLFVTKSYRADILNVLVILGLSAVPMAISSYVLTYKPYRQFILSPFFKQAAQQKATIHYLKSRPQNLSLD